MFPLHHMEYFYMYEETVDKKEFDIEEYYMENHLGEINDNNFTIQKSYIVFLNEFVKCCSATWSSYLKELNKKRVNLNKCTYSSFNESDESFVYWIIKLHYENEKKKVENSNNNTINKDIYKGKSGEHDAIQHLDTYINRYKFHLHNTKNSNLMIYWRNLFFNGLYQQSKMDNISIKSVDNTDLGITWIPRKKNDESNYY